MSFDGDKKRCYAAEADQALRDNDLRRAAFNMAKAAEFALKLADKTDGRVRTSYIHEARDFVELAEELRSKVPAVPPARAMAPTSAGKSGAASENGSDNRKPAKAAAPRAAAGANPDSVGDESDSDWLVTEKPNVRLTDIAGMDDVKAKLAEMVIEPLRHPEQAKKWGVRPGGGIMLFGPPGNGKTTLGKAVSGELGADFFYATGAEIRSKWHGESEQRLRKLILAARACPVSVLFLDDVDGLLPRRGGNSVVDNRIVVQFLAEIGGFADSPNVLLLLGATNKPWDIDEAVFRTGRFDEKIFVGLPDKAAREFMIRKNLGDAPVEVGVDPAGLAEAMEGYTGSDIVALVQSAKRAGFRRSISGGLGVLAAADIERAMKTIPSSATPAMMKEYERFAEARFK